MPAVHDDDPVSERHGFDLVVSDVDHVFLDLLTHQGKLCPHLAAQFGIEIGERLIKQENAAVLGQSAGHGDTLALTARERAGLAVEEFGQANHLSDLFDLGVDFCFRLLCQTQGKRDILGDVHMRVERIVLKDHRQITLFGFEVTDRLVVDVNLAFRDRFKSCDHPQCGGFSAT